MSRRFLQASGLVVALVLAVGATGCSFLRPALQPGTKACIGVPEAICKEVLDGRINHRAPVALTAYRIQCKSAACTNDAGEVDVDLAWADGQAETFAYSWFAAT